jgi:hypothetical protein
MKKLLQIVALCTLVGCATHDKLVFDNTKRNPTTNVEVFKDGEMPKKQYKIIAELSYLGPKEVEYNALKEFVKEARQMGGEAIVFYTEEAGDKGGGTIFQQHTFMFKAKVLVFK